MTSSVSKTFYGVYRGVVQHNNDPLNKGRLRVRVPQVLANETTDWAWFAETPNLNTGVPAVGQGVWVMFEGGNPSYPIWIGAFNNTASVIDGGSA